MGQRFVIDIEYLAVFYLHVKINMFVQTNPAPLVHSFLYLALR